MKNTTLVNTVSLAIFGFSMAVMPLQAAEHNHASHSKIEAHADHMLEGYNVVASALYKDDLATAKKAVEIATSQGDTQLAQSIQSRINKYASAKPWREK